MATEVKLPRLGQGMESGTIVKWLKTEGDAVKKREPLYELDTDKVTQEVEAEAEGVLLTDRRLVGLGCGLGRLRSLRRRSAAVRARRHVLTLAADEGDRPPYLDLTRVDDDLQQDAVGLRLDLLRHLVRVELVERLALLDRVALALEPLDDRAGLHPLAQPRELDLGRHG